MPSRVRLPVAFAAVYNVGLVFAATVGLITAFLLTLQGYFKSADDRSAPRLERLRDTSPHLPHRSP